MFASSHSLCNSLSIKNEMDLINFINQTDLIYLHLEQNFKYLVVQHTKNSSKNLHLEEDFKCLVQKTNNLRKTIILNFSNFSESKKIIDLLETNFYLKYLLILNLIKCESSQVFSLKKYNFVQLKIYYFLEEPLMSTEMHSSTDQKEQKLKKNDTKNLLDLYVESWIDLWSFIEYCLNMEDV